MHCGWCRKLLTKQWNNLIISFCVFVATQRDNNGCSESAGEGAGHDSIPNCAFRVHPTSRVWACQSSFSNQWLDCPVFLLESYHTPPSLARNTEFIGLQRLATRWRRSLKNSRWERGSLCQQTDSVYRVMSFWKRREDREKGKKEVEARTTAALWVTDWDWTVLSSV